MGSILAIEIELFVLKIIFKAHNHSHLDSHIPMFIWLMYECGDNDQKQRVYELVKTPKLRSLVKRHEPLLIRKLGLASKWDMKHELKDDTKERLAEFDKKYFSNIAIKPKRRRK